MAGSRVGSGSIALMAGRGIVRALPLLVLVLAVAFAPREARADDAAARVLVTAWTLHVPQTAEGPAREESVTLPRHLALPDEPVEILLRADVALPPALQDQELTLSIPYYGGLTTLRIDGEPAVSLERDLVRGYRARGPHAFRVPREQTRGAALSLELAVQHTWQQSAWFDTVPRLHRAGERDSHVLAILAVNNVGAALAFAALVQLGLTYLALYFIGRRRRVYVWFAIQVLTASYFNLFVAGFSQGVAGTLDAPLLAMAVVTAAITSIYFTHEQFDLGPPSRLWPALFGFDILLSVIFHDPFVTTNVLGKAVVATAGVVIIYQLVTLGRLTLRRPRPFGAEMVLATWLVLAPPVLFDGVSWVGAGELLGGVRGTCLGFALFALLQSLLLGREHVATLDRSDHLNLALSQRVGELEGRQREIQVLNDELRRQITDRSRQLFTTLALLGTEAKNAPRLEPGSLVQDRYRVVRPLGQGGMGTVYEVLRLADGRRLALKVTLAVDGLALARLAREAQIASQLRHPNVVDIVDVDIASSGFLYLVLEHVDGASLRELKERFSDLRWGLDVLHQVTLGLAALHASGIIHRDLKPANVLVSTAGDGRPLVKIADFGVSRLVVAQPASSDGADVSRLDDETVGQESDTRTLRLAPAAHTAAATAAAVAAATNGVDTLSIAPRSAGSSSSADDPALTEVGALVGTPFYMAPELAFDSHALSPAADIFGFGVMAYELLSGRRPFARAPSLERLEGRSIRPPAPLSLARLDVDPDLAEQIDACLSFEPTARPTAAALAERFERALRPARAASSA
jgi:serine/threonine protein kinase